MSSKGGGANKAKKQPKSASDDQTEVILKAVVLADSFQDRFKPFTLETPRCLLPLANTPMIEYTLEYLAMNGVQEVYLYCANHEEQIETYIHDSPRWGPNSGACPFSKLDFIRVSDASSIGDFLRDLDKRAVVTSDFILVHGDMVANIPLDPILAAHRARRQKNGDACMTMVLRTGGDVEHRTKPNGVTPIFVVDSATGQCLHYEEINPLQKEHHILLDESVLENGHEDVDIRSDLIDCGIDICTPDILALWSESFDYELPRKNFLHGVLKDWELNGKVIHAEILEEGYAARVSDLQMYDSISRDIQGRWTYPFVPEANLLEDQTFRMAQRGSYLEDGVLLGKGSSVSKSIIGKNTSLGTGSVILNSVVGRGCKIGDNVKIENSYIWDNVSIAENTTVSRSVLASRVLVGRNCAIPEGSLLSFGVQIGDDVSLPTSAINVLTLLSHDGSAVDSDTSIVGQAGKGAPYTEPVEEDDEDEDADRDPAILQKSLIYSLIGLNISADSISSFASSAISDDDDDAGSQAASVMTGELTPRDRLNSFASNDSTEVSSRLGGFHQDAVHGLFDALRSDATDDFDSAKLEFMGLRLSNNASDHAMQRAIATAFAMHVAELSGPDRGLEPAKAAQKALTSKKGAVKFIKEVGVGEENVGNQVDFALALQKALLSIKGMDQVRAGNLLAAVFQQLYNLDVLEEDGILAWWADKRASVGESMTKARERCRVLVEWLENADEEDSDEETEDDE